MFQLRYSCFYLIFLLFFHWVKLSTRDSCLDERRRKRHPGLHQQQAQWPALPLHSKKVPGSKHWTVAQDLSVCVKFACSSHVHVDFLRVRRFSPTVKVSSEWRRHSGCSFHFHLATSSNKMCNDSKPALPFPVSVERAEILTKLLLQCHESHSRELAVVKSESARVRRLDLEQRETRKRRKRATQGRDERGSFTAPWREGKRLCQAVSELSQSSSEAPRGDGRLNALLTSQ